MTPAGATISKNGHRCCERTSSFENERNFCERWRRSEKNEGKTNDVDSTEQTI